MITRLLIPTFTVGEALFLGSEPRVGRLPLLNRRKVATIGDPIVTVEKLCHRRAFNDVSFTVRRGEIVGITGLVGSGVKELIRSLFGLIHADSGKIAIDGNPVRLRSPSSAVGRRLALVPENRRKHGVALDLSVRENVTLADLRQYSRFGFLQLAREAHDVDELISRLSILTPHRNMAVRYLSGGHQQKVALAKWLSRRSSVYNANSLASVICEICDYLLSSVFS